MLRPLPTETAKGARREWDDRVDGLQAAHIVKSNVAQEEHTYVSGSGSGDSLLPSAAPSAPYRTNKLE